jgi:hypothetical protein
LRIYSAWYIEDPRDMGTGWLTNWQLKGTVICSVARFSHQLWTFRTVTADMTHFACFFPLVAHVFQRYPRLLLPRFSDQVWAHLTTLPCHLGFSLRLAPGGSLTWALDPSGTYSAPFQSLTPGPDSCSRQCWDRSHRETSLFLHTRPLPQSPSPFWTLNIYEFFKKKKTPQTSNNASCLLGRRFQDDKHYLEKP